MSPTAAWTIRRRHIALCTDADRFRTAVTMWSPADRRRGGLILAAALWWRQYHVQLLAHHRAEEGVWFPALVSRCAGLDARDLVVVADDHQYLDALAGRVDDALGHLIDPAAPFESTRRPLVTVIGAMANLLADHIKYEDRTFVSLIDKMLTGDEIAALSERARSLPPAVSHRQPHSRADQAEQSHIHMPTGRDLFGRRMPVVTTVDIRPVQDHS